MSVLQFWFLWSSVTLFATGYGLYDVTCVPTHAKGVLMEKWKSIFDLDELNKTISSGESPDSNDTVPTLTNTIDDIHGNLGYRFQTIFLCPITDDYSFYFTCEEACYWSIFETSELSSMEIKLNGLLDKKLQQHDFQVSDPASIRLVEGHAYYIDVHLYKKHGKGHAFLQIKTPVTQNHRPIGGEYAVLYRDDRKYVTLTPGEWEEWTECSGTCGLHGKQTRKRSCIVNPSLFPFYSEGKDLREIRPCSLNAEPCPAPAFCNYSQIIMNETQITSFFVPYNASSFPQNTRNNVEYNNSTNVFSVCYNTSVASYVEIKFNRPHYICAIESGSFNHSNATVFPPFSSYILELFIDYATNCSYWEFYNEETNITVFDAVNGSNISDVNTVINNLGNDYIVVQNFRIWSLPVEASCTGFKIYGEQAKAPTDPPRNLQVYNTSSTSLMVRWNLSKPYCPVGWVRGFVVKIFNESGVTGKHNVPVEEEEIELYGLKKYKKYCVTVEAVTKLEKGNYAEAVCAFTDEDVPSAPPSAVNTIPLNATSVKVIWGPVPNNSINGIVTDYEVLHTICYDAVAVKVVTSVGPQKLSLLLSNLKAYVEYCVKVAARTRIGIGNFSSWVNFTTKEFAVMDGNFSTWSEWSVCSTSCNTGQQIRHRTCNNPSPQNGGQNCSGEYNNSRNCNTHHCPVCLPGWTPFGSHCYQYQSSDTAWDIARKQCFNINSHLVSISFAGENEFVTSLTNSSPAWIGLNDRDEEGNYVWSDNTSYDFSRFETESQSSANAHCVLLNKGIWLKEICLNDYSFICKRTGRNSPTTLGMENGEISNDQINASTYMHDHEPYRARLGHLNSWCGRPSVPLYLQVDLLATFHITAIATQGNHDEWNKFVQQYKLEFSLDGFEWDFYQDEMGATNFSGNVDGYTVTNKSFSENVYTRYVRFWPTFVYAEPCMRVEIYGQSPIDSDDRPTSVLDVTVYDVGLHEFSVRWKLPPVYSSAKKTTGYKITCQNVAEEKNVTVDVGGDHANFTMTNLKRQTRYHVGILAFNDNGEGNKTSLEVTTNTACLKGWTRFQWRCYLLVHKTPKTWSDASINCQNLNSHLVSIQSLEEDQFLTSQVTSLGGASAFIGLEGHFEPGTNWTDGSAIGYTNWAPPSLPTVSPLDACVSKNADTGQWLNTSCLVTKPYICERKGFYSNGTGDCREISVGMETGLISNENITAASSMSPYSSAAARLGNHIGWCDAAVISAYIQVDLGNMHYICAVASQGVLRNVPSYVTKYAVLLSLNGTYWVEYEERFTGNRNYYGVVRNKFRDGVFARFVRISPKEWIALPCMRLEIYGVPAEPLPGPTIPPLIQNAVNSSSTSLMFDLYPPREYYAAHGILGYKVHYWKRSESAVNARVMQLPPGNVTANATGLEEYVEYCLSALVFTSHGDGKLSACVTAWTAEDVPDAAPSNVVVSTSSPTSVTVTWQQLPADLLNGNLLGYRIVLQKSTVHRQRRSLPENVFTVNETTLSWTLEGLEIHTNYCVQVLGFTRIGDGVASNWTCVLTEEDAPSAPPSNITAHSAGPFSIMVTWEPVPLIDRNGLVIGYKVMYATDAGSHRSSATTVNSSTTSYKVTGLFAYTSYCIQMVAYTSAGDGPVSACVIARTREGVPSAAPGNIFVDSNDLKTVDLRWSPIPSDKVQGELVGYAVLIQELDVQFLVSACYLSLQFQKENLTEDSCIRIAATTRAGFGNFTDCISITIPLLTFTTKQVSASLFRGISSVKVAWNFEDEEQQTGRVIGYFIKFQPTETGGEPVPDDQAHPEFMAVCSTLSEIILRNLTSYTKYKIQVAPLTLDGKLNYSDPVYGETCRCTKSLRVSLIPSHLDSSSKISGSLTPLITSLITDTCGYCEEHIATEVQGVSSDNVLEEEIIFPMSRIQAFGNTAYSKFIPVISVPGMVLIQKKGVDKGFLTKVMATSVLDSWPAFFITLIFAILAGIIIWFLDTGPNQEQFPRRYINGAGEGFWWAFITMTTVGYGDRCPQSDRGKVFGMAWSLIGLILFGIFMGYLTAVLTVTVINMEDARYNPQNKKVAVVLDSAEHQMAVTKFRNKVQIGLKFTDMSTMIQALREGNVSSALLEMYVPVTRKDLFNESWFEISDLLFGTIEHGVLLQGNGVKMAKDLENLIKSNNVQSAYLQQGGERVETEEEQISMVFFEPSSPYFFNTMVVGVSLLLLALICGLIYQASCLKRAKNEVDDVHSQGTCKRGVLKKEVTLAVEEFHANFSKSYKRIRTKHMAELMKYEAERKRI